MQRSRAKLRQKLAARASRTIWPFSLRSAAPSCMLRRDAMACPAIRFIHSGRRLPGQPRPSLLGAFGSAGCRSTTRPAPSGAQELLRPQLAHDDEDPDLQVAFARASELAGEPVRAGEAHAAAAYLNGRAEDALNQLKLLTASGNDLDYYQRTRIEARIAEMTPAVLELRRQQDQAIGSGPTSARLFPSADQVLALHSVIAA